MSTINQSAGVAGVQHSAAQTDPHEIGWDEVRELGLDPAPAGLTEDSEAESV